MEQSAIGMAALSADEVLMTTRAVRKRLDLDRPVERALIEECLTIALQAPTTSNTQPWEWMVVTDPEPRAAIASVYLRNTNSLIASNPYEGQTAQSEQTLAAVLSSGRYLADNLHRVPVLVIPMVKGRLDGLDAAAAASAWSSILPATWSFMLAARARGLGTAWTARHLYNSGAEEVAALLGVPAGEYTQAGLIPVAHTIGLEFKPAPRRPLTEVLHWNRW